MYRFRYEPVPESGGPWMRLLELEPRSSTDIHIQLKHVKLGEHPDFEALSYSWGTDLSKVPIWCNQRKFSIPRSLWVALNRLRKPHSGQSRLLWADAICINQDDMEEKTAQVQLMRQIYGAAKLVIVWLGEEAEGSHEAMQMVKNVGEGIWQFSSENQSMLTTRKRHQELVLARLPALTASTWATYWALLRRSWYSRVWIIQEVASAEAVLVVCGADEVLWRDFWNVGCHICQLGFHIYFPTQVSYLAELMVVGNAKETFQRNLRRPLIEMLFLFRNFQATDPRDKIFALYGVLHNDCRAGAIQPDYGLNPEDVFRKTTISILDAECNLDILSGPVNGYVDPTNNQSPSWVACWTMKDTPSPLTYQHIGRDPQFQASASSQYNPRFLEDQRIMEVDGFILDTITCVAQPATPVQPPTGNFAWMKRFSSECRFHKLFLDWELVVKARSKGIYFSGEDMVEVYWQTLLGGFTAFTDLNTNFGNPEADAKTFYRTLFERWDGKHRFYLYLHKTFHWLPGVDYLCCGVRLISGFGNILLHSVNYVLGRRIITAPGPQFSEYNYPATWRRAFRTEGGYVGLAPRFADVGDKIAILKGGRVAYALRPVSTRWRLLGDAYVHGVMRGEAFKEERCGRMLLE